MKQPYRKGDEVAVLAGKHAQRLNGQILKVDECQFFHAFQCFLVEAITKEGERISLKAINVKAIERIIYDVRSPVTGELIAQFDDFPKAVSYRDMYASKYSIDVYVCLHKHAAPDWEYIREVVE
jgi:hypothetical protein